MRSNKNYVGAILSLDAATHTGYAIYKDGTIIKSGTWRFKDKTRTGELMEKMEAIISEYGITQIVAEDIYLNPQKPNAFKALSPLQGVITGEAYMYNIEPCFIEPNKAKYCLWNKFRYGTYDPKEEKAQMIKAVNGLGYTLERPEADDEADAIGILLTYLYEQRIMVTHPNGTAWCD
jgi:Holliday junction resolvasome RuvABC endonuclease subunit